MHPSLEESHPFGAGVTAGCELPNVETELGYSARAANLTTESSILLATNIIVILIVNLVIAIVIL